MPDHPIVRLIGEKIAERIFPFAMPILFRYFAAPTNELRREHGLPAVGDLLDVVNWGDRIIFPDDPLITPLTHPSLLRDLPWPGSLVAAGPSS